MWKLAMKRLPIAFILAALTIGCQNSYTDSRQQGSTKSELVCKIYSAARRQAESSDPRGFLKLLEIANDDDTYTAEYSEVARDRIHILLYYKTDLWIKTYSQKEPKRIKEFIKKTGIEVETYPDGITTEEQYQQELFARLRQVKGNQQEMDLVNYILKMYFDKDT